MRKFLLGTSILVAGFALVNCGTLTGIPGHGGGKRFVEEQRLVSASIRGSLKKIDISALRGRRVAMIFSLISDEGSGNIAGGRASLSAILTGGTLISPVTTRSNALEVYTLANTSNSTSNTISAGSGTNTSSVVIAGSNTNTNTTNGNGTSTGTNTSTTNGSGTNTSNTNSSGTNTSTTNGSNTNSTNGSATTGASTTTQNGTTSGTSGTVTTTGATTTNQTGTSSGTNGSTSTTTPVTTTQTGSGTGTNTSTTNGSNTNTNTTNGSNTNTSTSNGSNTGTSTNTSTSNGSGTNNGTQNTDGSNTSNGTSDQTGATTGTQQTVVTEGFTEQARGHREDTRASLEYKGLGDYQVLGVPKSDASLLMSMTRNYFLLNEIEVTTPQDPTADAIVYVTVDIFGTDRKRTDLIIYNNERVSAETAIEMFAADRSGKIIMRPTVGNVRTNYQEDYILWAGPLKTIRDTEDGKGLMDDFTDQ